MDAREILAIFSNRPYNTNDVLQLTDWVYNGEHLVTYKL